MIAARIYGVKDVRIEDIPISEPEADEVQVRVKYTGICGSDIHGYHRGWALPTIPHPITGKVVPVVLGHESAGEIVKTGMKVKNLKAGDRVAIEPLLVCGVCEACRKGMYNCCENAVGPDGSGNVIGFGADGGFAEYVNVKANMAHPMPDGLDYQLGALVGAGRGRGPNPVQKRNQGRANRSYFRRGAHRPDDRHHPPCRRRHIRAFRGGSIGGAAGARKGYRGEAYDQFNQGRRRASDPRPDGNGVDVVYDAAGVEATFDSAAKCVKNTGVIQIVGVFNDPPKVNLANLLMRGVDIYTTLCYANVYPQTLRLMAANPVPYRKIITDVISLEDVVGKGLERLETDKSQAKVLVHCDIQRNR